MNRVVKTLVAGVATASLVGAPAIATVGAGTAGAVTAVKSPVGKYNATIVLTPSGSFPSQLKLKANGTFVFADHGPHGTWTETGNVVNMTGTIKKNTYAFVITQLGKKLGTAKKQGTITENGAPFGTWYAVRG